MGVCVCIRAVCVAGLGVGWQDGKMERWLDGKMPHLFGVGNYRRATSYIVMPRALLFIYGIALLAGLPGHV